MDPTKLKKEWGIALTGGAATGKSTVADIIRSEGYLVIDADQLARAALAIHSAGYKEVVHAFGPDYVAADGEIDRRKLRDRIFSDPKDKVLLESIVHKRIHAALATILERENVGMSGRPWFYEAALIFETGQEKAFRAVWVTTCSQATQLSRLQARESISQEQAQAFLKNQWPVAEKERRADVVINTDIPRDALATKVRELLTKWQSA